MGGRRGGGGRTSNDVVGEDRGELLLVGQDSSQGGLVDLSEGFVSGSEDGERTGALERVNEPIGR